MSDKNVDFVVNMRVERTIKSLEKNNMNGYFVNSCDDIVPTIKAILPQGSVVSSGGSMSLEESGVKAFLRSGYYNFLDRDKEGLTPEDIGKMYRDTFFADGYLTSTNALTENGELYNVDGNCNRIAAMAFGPEKVVFIVGVNKIVSNLDQAENRLKTIAAPANAKRLNCKTPCAVTGKCENCSSVAKICCNTLIMGQQRRAGRVHVIIVNENLGY